MAVGC